MTQIDEIIVDHAEVGMSCSVGQCIKAVGLNFDEKRRPKLLRFATHAISVVYFEKNCVEKLVYLLTAIQPAAAVHRFG